MEQSVQLLTAPEFHWFSYFGKGNSFRCTFMGKINDAFEANIEYYGSGMPPQWKPRTRLSVGCLEYLTEDNSVGLISKVSEECSFCKGSGRVNQRS